MSPEVVMAVHLHLEHGWTVKRAAGRFGLSPSVVAEWVERAQEGDER